MLARLLYQNSRYFTLVLLVILLVGMASLRSVGRQEDPTITNLRATVTTFFPGANPARVEALVSRPLEDEIREIPEVVEVVSTSSTGVSLVSVEVDDTMSASDIERAWTEIRDAVSDAQTSFPPGVLEPQFDNDIAVANTRIVAIRPQNGLDVPIAIIKRVAEDFADQARNFPGTKLVELHGEPMEEVRVELDEAALIARGISVAQVAAALQSADAKLASGRASGRDNDLLIEVAGDFDSLERIREVIVRSGVEGRAVRVSDIASVFKAEVTPPPSIALVEGVRGILVGISMEEGRQVDQWSQGFDAFIERFQQQAPGGVLVETSYNQSVYTEARLAEVSKNLLMGVLLVLLVLLFTLGWRAAVVVAVILPLCSLMSLCLMYYTGLPIHQMSVTGLVVALGLLVDGSIVMTDEVRKQLLKRVPMIDAIGNSVRRLRLPLFSSTATTILAFMPMAILPGPAGDFVGSIAKAVIMMLASSLLLALVVTPVLAAWLLPGGLYKQKRHWWDNGMESGRLGRALSDSLDWSLRHPVGSIALALVLPVAGFLAFPTLTAQFFPGTDRDQFYLQVKLPDGRSIRDTLKVVEGMDARLREYELVRRVDWMVGENAPDFYYNMMGSKQGIPSYAEALVLTHDENQTDALIRELQDILDQEFPQARTVVRGIDQGPPVSAPLEIELFGPNLDVLRELGEEFRLRMERIPQVTHSTTSLVAGAPKLVFSLDEEKLRLAQLELADVSRALQAGLQGAVGGEVLEDTERLPVRARLAEADWASPDQIASIRLPLAAAVSGEQLPAVALSTLGGYQLEPSRSPIGRKDGERVNTVQAYITRGVLPEEALKLLVADLEANPIAMPTGYRFQIGGDADERAEVVANIMAPIGTVLALLVATIVVTFNSWRLSAVAFLVCVCSLGLSLLSLAVFRYPFGIQAFIGVIGSVGVSINAAIIIMTALQLDEKAMRCNRTAMRDVVMDSSRHIVSTTITTFGGFLPLILEGSQFWPPFAMAIAGGVLLSTVVSFYLVPPMFLLANRNQPQSAAAPVQLAPPPGPALERMAS
ncbi:MAG: efflux RND transporter permease subunit [Halieaceae bacterium]|jgi:multidrug efflux pump subunit AcrB|nr:efflux RND transporter permease subunit [Halieaceae bacterium]